MVESKTVTRAHLVEVIFKKHGFSRSEASELVDLIFKEINNAILLSGELKISSFGTLKVRQKESRVGRNPKTKIEIPILPRKVVSFYASNIVRKKINAIE